MKILDDDGIEQIDRAARKILSQTGVLIPHERMLMLFERAGAKIDLSSGEVHIPSKLIDESLQQAGKSFTIYGRDRTKQAKFGQGLRNYNSIAGEAYWIDADGGRRFAALDDVITAAEIGEVLPNLAIVGAMSDPHEIDVKYRCLEVVAALLRTTSKPITFWFHDGPSAKFIVELLAAVAGPSESLAKFPLAYPFLEPISPLRFATDGLDVLFETSAVPLPVSIGPMAQVGLSAPGTLAATIAQETAEILAGICVTQLIRPGTPVCFGGIPHGFDMRTTQMIFAGPEQGMMAVAMTEMGKHYSLPVYINVGLTDSKCLDGQSGLEIGTTLMMGMLAGADIFGHLGIAGVDQASSIDMLVWQHEIITYLERIAEGFQLDDEHLALEVITEVGPGGTFIDHEHTAQHFRSELWIPEILDRDYWQQWEQGGRKSTAERVKEKLRDWRKRYEPRPLDANTEKDLTRILSAGRKHLDP